MIGDYLALTISKSQIETISKTGVILFDQAQLNKIHSFYTNFPSEAGVAASTFNDNLERFGSFVDVIWWFADEIRIPLVTDRNEQSVGMPNEKAWTSESNVLARIAPDGTPYRNGKETTYSELLAAIDALAAEPFPDPRQRSTFCLIVPPPHRGWAESSAKVIKELQFENIDTDPNKIVPRICEFLETYAHVKGVGLNKCW
ncbi:MAG: hypothetical protein KDK97_16735 [Verrucomicrobiales bacterium]|nr:hypothetical protein [Verrucomicrobiales bacterium]MCP5560544.1 hypothetical protein [Verrucomicrobiaceae bacterium]